MAKQTKRFTCAALSHDQIEYLANLPLLAERTIDNTKFVLCHAAPSHPLYEYVPANSPQWEQDMELVFADILLVGHTHTPFVQNVGGSLVVNPGSLGQPNTGSTKACYALWDNGISPVAAPHHRLRWSSERKLGVALHRSFECQSLRY